MQFPFNFNQNSKDFKDRRSLSPKSIKISYLEFENIVTFLFLQWKKYPPPLLPVPPPAAKSWINYCIRKMVGSGCILNRHVWVLYINKHYEITRRQWQESVNNGGKYLLSCQELMRSAKLIAVRGGRPWTCTDWVPNIPAALHLATLTKMTW